MWKKPTRHITPSKNPVSENEPPNLTPRPLPHLIGLGGHLRSGKDTVADHLVAAHGYVKIGMSDPLHEALRILDPLIERYPGAPYTDRYSQYVERVGYTRAKEVPEVRRLLQRLGTEVGRGIFGEDVWAELARRRIRDLFLEDRKVVITGIRFENERDMVKDLGGVTWWIERPADEHTDTQPDPRFSKQEPDPTPAMGHTLHMQEQHQGDTPWATWHDEVTHYDVQQEENQHTYFRLKKDLIEQVKRQAWYVGPLTEHADALIEQEKEEYLDSLAFIPARPDDPMRGSLLPGEALVARILDPSHLLEPAEQEKHRDPHDRPCSNPDCTLDYAHPGPCLDPRYSNPSHSETTPTTKIPALHNHHTPQEPAPGPRGRPSRSPERPPGDPGVPGGPENASTVPSMTAQRAHSSEASVTEEDFDLIFVNNGTIEGLHRTIENVLRHHR